MGVHRCKSLFSVSVLRFLVSECTCKVKIEKVFFSAQEHQEKATQGEELWAAVDKTYQSLMKTLNHGRAESLRDQMEGARKRSVMYSVVQTHAQSNCEQVYNIPRSQTTVLHRLLAEFWS